MDLLLNIYKVNVNYMLNSYKTAKEKRIITHINQKNSSLVK